MTTSSKAIPRYRSSDGPAIFSQGFRPFFLGAGLWAFASILLWLPIYGGSLSIPTVFDPVYWHAHEMLFGFVTAVVAGFMLTAIPNWTGRLPLQGLPLATLFLTWLTGRVAVAISGIIGAEVAAVLDLSFLALLFAVVLREITAGRNWRNLPMTVALAGLFVGCALSHAESMDLLPAEGTGNRLGIGIVVLLISMIGGRVIPSFTRNWLVERGCLRLPARPGTIDHICLAIVIVGLGSWVVVPVYDISGAFLVVAGLVSLFRLARWSGEKTVAEPLVWSLHVGFAWVPVGLLMIGSSVLWPQVPYASGLHTLTTGAFGSMTLAVMTRAILGHTGHTLSADGWTTIMYILIGTAAALRVLAPLVTNIHIEFLWSSALAWVAAFGIFTAHYGRMLISR